MTVLRASLFSDLIFIFFPCSLISIIFDIECNTANHVFYFIPNMELCILNENGNIKERGDKYRFMCGFINVVIWWFNSGQ